MTKLHSRLYRGWVRHRRYQPQKHAFKYPVFMSWIALNELDRVIKQSLLWSKERFNLVSFYRQDYLGNPDRDIQHEVKQRILEQTGNDFCGRVCLLTNLRYLGFSFNPVSFYFCYLEHTDYPRYILAEVNNTPWNERYCYVLDTKDMQTHKGKWSFEFDKEFHVSPFMPMNLSYHWQFSLQPKAITIHMSLHKEQQHCFDATLQLHPSPMNAKTMRRTPLHYPFMTLAVVFWIYWQAFRLWLKRIPSFDHPSK